MCLSHHLSCKGLLAAVFAVLAQVSIAQSQLDWGDQGNGTYKNPVLNADYSDPDVIRVGEKYYLVASDFNHLGMQVLESDDMVNWRIISQIYRRFNFPGWNENAHYAGGSWAPSIRWHDGRFCVFFCTPDEGLFMSTAEDARGPWSPLHLVKAVQKWEDPCPFWDDDGKAYLGRSQWGAGPIIVHRMSPDGRELLDDGVTVYTGPVAEGTKWLKRDGYYYLIIPEGGVEGGWQTVLRSKNIYGPYEKRIVLEQGSTSVNGPHQGSLVDTPDGEWWFYHFQHTPVLGRVVHLQPARWKDGWPLIGVDIDGNGVGEPVAVWTKPGAKGSMRLQLGSKVQKLKESAMLPATSDDFNGESLGLQWQWNHNPEDSHWNLSEKCGWLTLCAMPAEKLKSARNTLTQKMMGYEGTATTLLDCSDITDETVAGLVCMGREFRSICVTGKGIIVCDGDKREMISNKKSRRIYLRIALSATPLREEQGLQQFFYSTDGKTFIAAGEPFQMHQGFWKGVRIGLCCYGNKGKARYDFFNYEITR